MEEQKEGGFVKPDWLAKLEAESWQAELIISGVAIFGTLQLPGLVDQALHWALFALPETATYPAFLIYTYLAIGAIALAGIFILHFVLRALWVGMIGLASVFPQGIREEHPNMSREFMRRLRQDFPNIHKFNQQLDDIGSLLFAIAFITGFTMLGFGMSLTLFITLSLLIAGWTGLAVQTLFIAFILVFAGPVVFSSFLMTKPLKESGFARRYHYPLVRYPMMLLLNIGFRPYMYIQYTLFSNIHMQRFYGSMITWTVAIMVVGFTYLVNSDASFLLDKVAYDAGSRTDRLLANNYDNLRPEGVPVVHPSLPSDVYQPDRPLQVFVPLPRRTEERMLQDCSLPDDRDAARQRYLDCIRSYYTFDLNGRVQADYLLFRYDHPSGGEPGFLATFMAPSLLPGKNVLSISKPVAGNWGEVSVDSIPFFFAGDATLLPTDTILSR